MKVRTKVLAIDPGRHIGVAYVSAQGELIAHSITNLVGLEQLDIPVDATIVVGNGTGGQRVTSVLHERNLSYHLVEERNTSLEARHLYFHDNPPQGWLRLLPKGLRAPTVLIDDYAAYAIALRYLRQVSS
ncbi:MAG: pre-16S rRNA-processing nuclease YqgF [Deinococcota bacterium]